MFNIIIYGSFFLDLSFLYNDISCGTRKKNWKIEKLKKKHLKTQKCEKIYSAFFTSFFFIYLFCGMIKAVKWKKRFQKFKTQKKHLKIQNFEKSHSAFFAHFCFIYLFCKMIKAVKYKKKISKFQNSKKPLKIQNFEKSHSAFFVPFSLIYRFQLSTEKVKKWPFWGGGGRGPGGYQTVNNGTEPKKVTQLDYQC